MKYGVYEKEELIAVFFSESRAKGYEKYLNRMMQTCRFETIRLVEQS